ncbi:MAG: adenylate cyclase, class 2 [Patescibacteria group bacterium]|nr:adenylate cyclase, class 2 [Patescibacteria group bacterium]
MHAPSAGTVQEAEGKVLDIDPEVEIAKLLSLGYARTFQGELIAKFFVNDRDQALRLRLEESGWVLNYKGGAAPEETEQVKIRPELETGVTVPENMEAILEAIGFEKVRTVTKTRTTFILENGAGEKIGHVEIDEYPGIPPLLEIESDTHDKVLAIGATLGFPPERIVSDTIRDLEKRYGVRLGTKE